MCSMRLPESVFGVGGEAALLSAVSDVGERSFFAIVDPCDDERFAELASAPCEWLVATVRFHEGPCEGQVSCALPASLALQLYDAFTGREPDEPAPSQDQLFDLIGEFGNMICGAWLTRAASHQTFSLNTSVVVSWPEGWVRPGHGRDLALVIDDCPLLIDVDIQTEPVAVANGVLG